VAGEGSPEKEKRKEKMSSHVGGIYYPREVQGEGLLYRNLLKELFLRKKKGVEGERRRVGLCFLHLQLGEEKACEKEDKGAELGG